MKVVEVGVWHAGPGANVVLADLGAEVIKVESLRGEPERHTGKFGNMDTESLDSGDWTLIFEISNRNKQSIQIDIGSDEGRELLHKLVAEADVFPMMEQIRQRRIAPITNQVALSQIAEKVFKLPRGV